MLPIFADILASHSHTAQQALIARATDYRSNCLRTKTFATQQEADDFDAGWNARLEMNESGCPDTPAGRLGWSLAERREDDYRERLDDERAEREEQ